MKKKTNSSETEITLENPVVIPAIAEDNVVFANLSASLAEIRKLKGVMGYILRNPMSAIIDFNEPEKISEYAILSSKINESCGEIAELFNLRQTESVLVEGKNIKVLLMNVGQNCISVFMEISATHSWIIKRVLL